MTYRVGQEIVCVEDRWGHHNPEVINHITLPTKGAVYHIREFVPSKCCPLCAEKAWIRLVEIVNTDPWFRGNEPIFDLAGFRPVHKTDISIFTAMCNPTPKTRVRRKEVENA